MNKDKRVYELAYEYLLNICPKTVELEKYFTVDKEHYKSLKDVFVQFIDSAQNYQRMPKVINFKGRKKTITRILNNFDYLAIKDMDEKDLYHIFRKEFKITTKDNKQNSWYKWSCSIIDSAKFISQFSNKSDFEKFVDKFSYNVSTRMALPLLISTKIRGIGFALACDLLKELGYMEYPKPDVHLKKIFNELGLSDNDQISVFEAIVRMSNECRKKDKSITPYKIDKVFWLISSGNYYMEKPEISIRRHKRKFIEYAKKNL